MSVRLYSTGDIMLGENVHHFRRGIIKKFKTIYTSLISEEVRAAFADADFVLINLESCIASDEYIKTRNIENGVYVAPLESLDLLKKLSNGIIANVANNHFSQHGYKSASFTINLLEQEGISVIGKDHLPLSISKNGSLLNIWGVSLIKDKNTCGAYFQSTYENLISEINPGTKQPNEIRIISIHWGEEYYTLENEKQRALANELSKAGFDLILGHHPHVIQPVTQINQTSVIYSHGNFIFDQNFSVLTQKGLICRFDFADNKPEFLFSQQKGLKVIGIESTDPERINTFCIKNYHINNPLIMRIKMKLELLRHFYELNIPLIITFALRLFNKK